MNIGQKLLLSFVGGIIVILGCIGFYFFTIKPLLQVMDAHSWQATPCTIIESDVAGYSGTYQLDINYTYHYGGKEYSSNQYGLSDGYQDDYAGKKKVVDQLPPGSQAMCYVNPQNPSEAVLNRSPGPSLLVGFFSLFFAFVGALLPVIAFRFMNQVSALHDFPRPTQQQTGKESVHSSGLYQSQLDSPGFPLHAFSKFTQKKFMNETKKPYTIPHPTGSNSSVLMPKETAKDSFFAFTIFAIAWNVILWLIIIIAFLPSLRNGDGNIWEIIFFSPFILVGIILFVCAARAGLATKNPIPILELRSRTLFPGSQTIVTWDIQGQAYKMKSFKIELLCREEIKYSAGTRTLSDNHTVYSQTLYESHAPGSFRNGSLKMEIPDNAMPSFTAPHNKITWYLKVHGTIPLWPDVNTKFLLFVNYIGGEK